LLFYFYSFFLSSKAKYKFSFKFIYFLKMASARKEDGGEEGRGGDCRQEGSNQTTTGGWKGKTKADTAV
jgi:hypothetical protein